MKAKKSGLWTLLFLLSIFNGQAQERRNSPLPELITPPYARIGDSIAGWSRSTDGQWLSRRQVIPLIGISRDKDFYETKDAELGIDNIRALLAYRVQRGRDTLVALVKLFDDGRYKFPLRQRGWRTERHAYYVLVELRYLREAIQSVENKEVEALRIKGLDGGTIPKVKEKKLAQRLQENLLIKDKYDRNLILTVQLFPKESIARFHLCSMHEVFPDVEGVRKNFTRRGRTVYGSSQLFDYFYFEWRYDEFMSLFHVPKEEAFLEADDGKSL